MDKLTVGFLGLGNMGSAIYLGLNDDFEKIAFDIHKKKDERFHYTESIEDCISKSDILILAVKPNTIEDVISKIKSPKTIISIAAGINFSYLKDKAPIGSHVIRTMPNLPIVYSKGVLAYYGDKEAYSVVEKIFAPISLTLTLEKESNMDAITGLSGSGPAFVFSFIQALAEGGVKSGLSYSQSLVIAIETVLGSAEYLKRELESKSATHPMELRNRVTSPGGTTIFGLAEWEKNSINSGILESVYQASLRSKNLS